jgi:hypothetical protein
MRTTYYRLKDAPLQHVAGASGLRKVQDAADELKDATAKK